MRTKEEVIAEVEHLTQIHSTIRKIEEKYFNNLIKEAKHFNLWSEIIHIHCNLANIYFNTNSDFINAIKELKKGKRLLKKKPSLESVARLHSVTGNYFRLKHELPNAIQNLKTSLILITEVNEVKPTIATLRLEFNNYYLMALIFGQLMELPKNKYYLLKAEKLAYKIADYRLIANCLMGKGDYYQKLKKYELAEDNLMKAIQILKEVNEKYSLGNAMRKLADVYYERKEFKLSLDYYVNSYNLLTNHLPNQKFCSLQCRIGENYFELYQMDKAKHYFDMAYESSLTISNKSVQIGVLESLCKFHSKTKEYEKVIFFRDKIDIIKTEIEEIARIKSIYEIEEKYQSTLKQKEINFRKKKQKDTNRYLKLMKQKNEDLQQFSYALAHDLREPIRSTKNFINVVAKKVNNPELDIYMNVVNGNLDRMYQLVDDILSLTKLDFDEVHIDEVDMNEIMEEIKDHLAMQIEERSANIVYGDLPKVMGNKNHLLQLFQNLISNGMKYNRNQPMIEIRYDATIRGKGAFMVKDNGIGIPADKQSQVFGLFKRAHGKEFQGTGVGLAICKKIVEKMKGEIWLESAEGKGSTFFMRLET